MFKPQKKLSIVEVRDRDLNQIKGLIYKDFKAEDVCFFGISVLLRHHLYQKTYHNIDVLGLKHFEKLSECFNEKVAKFDLYPVYVFQHDPSEVPIHVAAPCFSRNKTGRDYLFCGYNATFQIEVSSNPKEIDSHNLYYEQNIVSLKDQFS